MNEAGFWRNWVKPALNRPPAWVAWKMDPGMRPGFPDVLYNLNGVAGLLELKYIPEFPKRSTTPIHLHYRPDQRAHLREWGRSGGRAHLLVGLASEWFLLPPQTSDRELLAGLRCFALEGGSLTSLRIRLPAWLTGPAERVRP